MYNHSYGASRAALGVLLLLAAAPALADETHEGPHHNQIDGTRFDVHADIGTWGAFGVGIRADIPVLVNGVLPGVDDELAISPGVEVFFADFYRHEYEGGPYLMPVAMLQWNFYLGESFSVFPEAGVAMYIGDGAYLPGGRNVYAGFGTGVGGRYHFSTRNALLVRVGWPAGLQAGLTF